MARCKKGTGSTKLSAVIYVQGAARPLYKSCHGKLFYKTSRGNLAYVKASQRKNIVGL